MSENYKPVLKQYVKPKQALKYYLLSLHLLVSGMALMLGWLWLWPAYFLLPVCLVSYLYYKHRYYDLSHPSSITEIKLDAMDQLWIKPNQGGWVQGRLSCMMCLGNTLLLSVKHSMFFKQTVLLDLEHAWVLRLNYMKISSG